MPESSNKYFFLLTCTLLISVGHVFAQIPDFSKVPNLQEGDSLNITKLLYDGVKISVGKAICWFPKDSLSESGMFEIAKLMDSGIAAAEKYIHAPRPWQLHETDQPYVYYFRMDRFISHASLAGFVSIPFWRIKAGRSPWLHETLHEMLATKNGSWISREITEAEYSRDMPLWLFEGLPDYLSLKISLKENWSWFDVFTNSFQSNPDSLFLKEIESMKGPYILSFIGSKGVIPELYSNDRILFAPAFYHGSSSFVQFLEMQYSLNMLLESISSFKKENVVIERVSGKSLESLKQDWLRGLKYHTLK